MHEDLSITAYVLLIFLFSYLSDYCSSMFYDMNRLKRKARVYSLSSGFSNCICSSGAYLNILVLDLKKCIFKSGVKKEEDKNLKHICKLLLSQSSPSIYPTGPAIQVCF